MKGFKYFLLLLFTTFLSAGHSPAAEGKKDPRREAPRPEYRRSPLELTSGSGVVLRLSNLLSGQGPAHAANWVDLKVRPFSERVKWQALGFQLGTHQTEEMSLTLGCRLGNGLTRRELCADDLIKPLEAQRFMALYAGIHGELIELLSGEPRPVRVYLGTGAATLHSSFTPRAQIAAYASVEILFQLRRRLNGKAGFFISHYAATQSLMAALPTLSFEYRF